MRGPSGEYDPVFANRHGQQLFFVLKVPRNFVDPRPATTSAASAVAELASTAALHYRQLTLFDSRRDLAALGRSGLHERGRSERADTLEALTRQVSSRLGWSRRKTADTCIGLRIVLGIQDDPDALIKASDVELLRDIGLGVGSVLAVLAEAGALNDDRTPALDRWALPQIESLPEPMRSELNLWFDVMKNGSAVAPRRRPRNEITVRLHLRWALPVLQAWAAEGHSSLREITKTMVLDALPASGNPRSTTGQGLKSVFRLLKARNVIFTNPTTRVKTGGHANRQPVPLDVAAIHDALVCDDPARAVVVALIAFHGLRVGHLQRLALSDLSDGTLRVDGRSITLADPVRERLRTYIDSRVRRWPNTANEHLFIHHRTAMRSEPVGRRWMWLTVGPGLSPSAIREDRILNEAHATGGDMRRLTDLFGLSVNAATRYTNTVDHPDLIAKAGVPRA
jgi:integrase